MARKWGFQFVILASVGFLFDLGYFRQTVFMP